MNGNLKNLHRKLDRLLMDLYRQQAQLVNLDTTFVSLSQKVTSLESRLKIQGKTSLNLHIFLI